MQSALAVGRTNGRTNGRMDGQWKYRQTLFDAQKRRVILPFGLHVPTSMHDYSIHERRTTTVLYCCIWGSDICPLSFLLFHSHSPNFHYSLHGICCSCPRKESIIFPELPIFVRQFHRTTQLYSSSEGHDRDGTQQQNHGKHTQ